MPPNGKRGKFEGTVLTHLEYMREGIDENAKKLIAVETKIDDSVNQSHKDLEKHKEDHSKAHGIAKLYWMLGLIITGMGTIAGYLLFRMR